MDIKNLFSKPQVIGVISNANQGKSMMLYHFLEELKKEYNFKTYSYGLRIDIENNKKIFSVAELEETTNSVIIIDEFATLIDIDNRKVKKQVENTIRLIYHNNNVLLLCGLGQNFPKFISSKLDIIIYKKILLADLINGSSAQRNIINYKGYELGSTILNLAIDEAIIYYKGSYEKINIPYLAQYDSKKDNIDILNKIEVVETVSKPKRKKGIKVTISTTGTQKNIPEIVQKTFVKKGEKCECPERN